MYNQKKFTKLFLKRPNWKLLTRSLADLKKYHFQFKNNILDKNKEMLNQVISNYSGEGIYIGVHVRRTDYISFRYLYLAG